MYSRRSFQASQDSKNDSEHKKVEIIFFLYVLSYVYF